MLIYYFFTTYLGKAKLSSSDKLMSWDPMQLDFLSQKNRYSVDDEDFGSVLLGHSKYY